MVVAWRTSQCTPYEFRRNLRPYNSFSIYQAFFLGHPQAGSRQEMHSEKKPLWKKVKFFSAGRFSRSSHFTLVTFFAARFIFSPILSSNNILLIFDRPIRLVLVCTMYKLQKNGRPEIWNILREQRKKGEKKTVKECTNLCNCR